MKKRVRIRCSILSSGGMDILLSLALSSSIFSSGALGDGSCKMGDGIVSLVGGGLLGSGVETREWRGVDEGQTSMLMSWEAARLLPL